jgi:hypothetical protein
MADVAADISKPPRPEVSNLRQQYMVASPTGLGPENDCAGESQQQL